MSALNVMHLSASLVDSIVLSMSLSLYVFSFSSWISSASAPGLAAGLCGLIWDDLDGLAFCCTGSRAVYCFNPSNISSRTIKNQNVMKIVWISVNVKYKKSTLVSTVPSTVKYPHKRSIGETTNKKTRIELCQQGMHLL